MRKLIIAVLLALTLFAGGSVLSVTPYLHLVPQRAGNPSITVLGEHKLGCLPLPWHTLVRQDQRGPLYVTEGSADGGLSSSLRQCLRLTTVTAETPYQAEVLPAIFAMLSAG